MSGTNDRGKLIVISGPAGVGKTTICERLVKRPGFRQSVSCTTRAPRKGEVPGEHYEFITPDDFRRRIEASQFIEWAEVHGHLYGTPRAFLEETVAEGKHLVLNIDVQGADQLRGMGLDAVYIFILPPDMEALRERLFKRRTDRTDEVERRLERAEHELAESARYDFRVVNDELDACVAGIESWIKGSLGQPGTNESAGRK